MSWTVAVARATEHEVDNIKPLSGLKRSCGCVVLGSRMISNAHSAAQIEGIVCSSRLHWRPRLPLILIPSLEITYFDMSIIDMFEWLSSYNEFFVQFPHDDLVSKFRNACYQLRLGVIPKLLRKVVTRYVNCRIGQNSRVAVDFAFDYLQPAYMAILMVELALTENDYHVRLIFMASKPTWIPVLMGRGIHF